MVVNKAGSWQRRLWTLFEAWKGRGHVEDERSNRNPTFPIRERPC